MSDEYGRTLVNVADELLEKAKHLLHEAHKLGEVHDTLINQAREFVMDANKLIAKAKELEE